MNTEIERRICRARDMQQQRVNNLALVYGGGSEILLEAAVKLRTYTNIINAIEGDCTGLENDGGVED